MGERAGKKASPPPETWADVINERVADAILDARKARGFSSAQQLADETKRVDMPVSRSVLANLDSGRKRKLSVAELVAISAALGVDPGDLLTPGSPRVQIGTQVDQLDAAISALRTARDELAAGGVPLDQLARVITGQPARSKEETP
jgi:transcriptional regulator with XRE-family HTH domain